MDNEDEIRRRLKLIQDYRRYISEQEAKLRYLGYKGLI